MELAGALPPSEAFGRGGGKAGRPAGASAKNPAPGAPRGAQADHADPVEEDDEDLMIDGDLDSGKETLLLEEDEDGLVTGEHEEHSGKNPPEIDPAA